MCCCRHAACPAARRWPKRYALRRVLARHYLPGPALLRLLRPALRFRSGRAILVRRVRSVGAAFHRARAVMRYDDASRKLVSAFKHGDRLHFAPAFGQWLKRAGAELLADADLIVPVPLHWTRLFARRYNQAAVLAHALKAAGGPPVAPDWLIRKRRTPPQGKTGPNPPPQCRRRLRPEAGQERQGQAHPRDRRRLHHRATVSECARVLKRNGAAQVDVLTLARTVRMSG